MLSCRIMKPSAFRLVPHKPRHKIPQGGKMKVAWQPGTTFMSSSSVVVGCCYYEENRKCSSCLLGSSADDNVLWEGKSSISTLSFHLTFVTYYCNMTDYRESKCSISYKEKRSCLVKTKKNNRKNVLAKYISAKTLLSRNWTLLYAASFCLFRLNSFISLMSKCCACV